MAAKKIKKVVNLDKLDFDIIKKYCELNALSMPKWLAKLAIDKINDLQKETV